MSMRIALCLVLAWPLAGCFGGDHHDFGGTCASATAMTIDSGASVDHATGVDPGYYATYTAGGHWHVEWTCDTKLSAEGCNFTGSITFDTASGAAAPSCFQCESDDELTATAAGGQTRLDFDTLTSTGLDGVDFDSVPGHAIQLDLQIDGIAQNDLVFVPSGGQTASPACMPLALTPDAP